MKAYAKINLSLFVTGARPDGYHLLSTVMQTIGLYDEIIPQKLSSGISLSSEGRKIPLGKENTVFRACEIMQKEFALSGIGIHIKKNIPIGAGLGGPSADAAAAINAIDDCFGIGLSYEEKCNIAVRIGADVPFLIKGGCCYCEGIGDIITPVFPGLSCQVLIVKPDVSVLSKDAYRDFDKLGRFSAPNKQILSALASGDLKQIAKNIGNDLEEPVFLRFPIIEQIKESMNELGAVALMSGSGASVFGLFETKALQEKCREAMEKRFPLAEIFVVDTVNAGVDEE